MISSPPAWALIWIAQAEALLAYNWRNIERRQKMTQSDDLPELLRCINCGWVYYAAAADEKALESCFKCACSEFEPVGPASVPRGVTILAVRQQGRVSLAGVLGKFKKFSPDFMGDGRGDHSQSDRTVETNAAPKTK